MAVSDVQTDFLQLLGHPWASVAAQAETRLFFDVRQNNHIRSLPLSGRAAAMCAQPTYNDTQNLAKTSVWEVGAMLFDEPEPHDFWLAKKAVAFLGCPSPP